MQSPADILHTYQASRWSQQPPDITFTFFRRRRIGRRTRRRRRQRRRRRRISFAILGFRKCMQWSCYCNQSWKKAIIMYDMILLSNWRRSQQTCAKTISLYCWCTHCRRNWCICKTAQIISRSSLVTCRARILISIVNAAFPFPPIQLSTGSVRARWLWLITLISDHRSLIIEFVQLQRFVISARLNTYTSFVGEYVRLLLSFPFIIPLLWAYSF